MDTERVQERGGGEKKTSTKEGNLEYLERSEKKRKKKRKK